MHCRRGATGSYIYRTRGSQADEKAAMLVAAISTTVPGVRASSPRRFGVLRIFGLDASASRTEIRNAPVLLSKGVDPNLVEVGDIVVGRGNLGHAYVRAPEIVAREEVRRGSLTVGWTKVRIVGLPKRPVRCFRCRARGHVTARCPCPDEVGKACYKCGNTGHISRDCIDEPCCLSCKKAGRGWTDDTAGSPICPIVSPRKLSGRSGMTETGGREVREHDCTMEVDPRGDLPTGPPDLVAHRMVKVNAGMAIVMEPWWISSGSTEWFPALGGSPSSAVWLKCVVISTYFQPGRPLVDFEGLLEDLGALLEEQPWPLRVIVAGDFNARSAAWGPGCRENARRRLLKKWLDRNGLHLLNNEGQPKCVRPQGSSVVDLVWVTGALKNRTVSCYIDDEESLSNQRDRRLSDFPRWKTSKVDKDRLGAALISAERTKPVRSLGAEARVRWIRSSLRRACDIALPQIGLGNGRRKMVHCADVLAELLEGRRVANKALKLAIRSAKENSRRDLLGTRDSDPWGRPYRLVMGKLRAAAAPLTESLGGDDLDLILDGLFPTDEAAVDSAGDTDSGGFSEISAVEVCSAAKKITGSRAPGPDGVAGMVVRKAAVEAPSMVADCLSACLREGVFSSEWRVTRLVLVRKKAGGLAESPSC
ncbi:hypothetical protein M0802_012727 [Mischocyttarus mexicanus]|nr:hypothetical protein M0802_012727 [Mischocyttarus mexicanus]